MEQKIVSLVKKYISLGNSIYSSKINFDEVEIRFDLLGSTAGYAIREADGSLILRFNMPIAEENEDEFEQVVGHEVAHLFQFEIRSGSEPHGLLWQSIMESFNLPANRLHSFSTYNSKIENGAMPYFCPSCNKKFAVSKIIHNKILRGEYRICNKCRVVIEQDNSAYVEL